MKKGEEQNAITFTQEEIKKEIKQLKDKKAGDSSGWKNELIKNGGLEMEKSLVKIFNKLMEELTVPNEWEDMRVKSVYKNIGSIKEFKNRRGLFLTSIISKLFEKLMKSKTEITTCESQNGGKKGRSTKDNWLALMAIIDNAKRMGEKCVLYFADNEKCFDKLRLEDCLADMQKAGMREREVVMLLNERQR